MKVKALEIIVLTKDLIEHGLKSGDTGTVVELYEPDGVEVEFITGTGRTKAVVTLAEKEVRKLRENDIMAVRSANAA